MSDQNPQAPTYTPEAWTAAQKTIDAMFAAKIECYSEAEMYGALVSWVAGAIAAAEQRGRVAGLSAARDAMCLDCRQGSKPILDRRRGEWEHWPDSSFSWPCHAGAIHALIAEEAHRGE